MIFEKTEIADVVRIVPDIHPDARGFFMETWQAGRFAEAGISATFVQDNYSQSSSGTLRGLHYQIERAQGKLVRVVSGEVFDVAVDLRKSSPTFGDWVGEILSAENNHMLWVPPGFAHGFLVVSDLAIFEYKCTDYYAPEFERSIRWDDPALAIEWPLAEGERPAVSTKDSAALSFEAAETYA